MASNLTPAQIEVCAMFHRGYRLTEIADMTDRSVRTVKELRRRAHRTVDSLGGKWPKRVAGLAGARTYAASPLIDAA